MAKKLLIDKKSFNVFATDDLKVMSSEQAFSIFQIAKAGFSAVSYFGYFYYFSKIAFDRRRNK
ncbi:hypothetical protein [Peribacillus sp. FSL R5-0717]|uniref:hypothetical protein n=1 Tax=Peribacillus sp. FSL R5-0717 TaxID=2975308 RepID=UPI0030F8AFB7